MKDDRILTCLLFLICLLHTGDIYSETTSSGTAYEVTTETTKKGILLEEYTGIKCGNCPDGHAMGATLLKADTDAYVVAIHAGGYSDPYSDQPDYRTTEGVAINTNFNVERYGYPSGSINRHIFDESSASIICNRSLWIPYSKYLATEDAPVNLLVKSAYDGATRKLTVHVEGYYTALEQLAEQQLNVLWTQDNIKGPQSGANMGDDYVHQHMLRGYISALWGDALEAPTQGKYFEKDYTMTLPEEVREVSVKPEDIRVIAFVTNGKTDVLNVTGAKPVYTNLSMPTGGTLSTPKLPVGAYYGYNFFDMVLTNKSDKPITTATFDVIVNDVTTSASWNGEIPPFDGCEITIKSNYSMKETGSNDYRIVLKTINGESVAESALEGTFTSPIAATPTISIKFKTNHEASDNNFYVKDADGNVVKEFGPYEDGKVGEYDESITLDANSIYCIEVTDSWGDGIYSPAGYFTSHSSDGSLIEQVYKIADFGTRSFFRTSKGEIPSGIDAPSFNEGTDANVIVYSMNGTTVYNGLKSGMTLRAGTYIVYDKARRTMTKRTIK